MKIPKSIKLPRKLKKELKKEVERRVKNFPPIKINNGVIANFATSYLGSNTKPFKRLCRFFRKEERMHWKRSLEGIMREHIESLTN